MTCREFTEFIAQYLAGELPSSQREPFDRHLRLCVNCVRYVEQYRQTIEMSRSAFDDEQDALPADVPEELVEAILRARKATGSN